MLGSLLGLHPSVGWTREEVVALLGRMNPFRDPSHGSYDLRLAGDNPYGLAPAGLVLEFRDDKVRGWEIRTES